MLDSGGSTRARRSIAILSYIAQYRPEMFVVMRTLAQQTFQPIAVTDLGTKRLIRHQQSFLCGTIEFNGFGDQGFPRVPTESVWAMYAVPRRPCSGGWTELEGSLIWNRSKLQSKLALSAGEAALNAVAKCISGGAYVLELCKDMCGLQPHLEIRIDANAHTRMLLCTGAG